MVDKIASLCLNKFDSLPKSGKPQKGTEWTVLSCIVQQQVDNFEVVALGTGTKCLGRSQMCSKGTVINDSHAEVVCRRAFVLYLYSQLVKTSRTFDLLENEKFTLKTGMKFHFFTSQAPCGDAAIFPKDESTEPEAKRRKIDDINRTGAKCLEIYSKQDLKIQGRHYHEVGLVRTKPGRGDPTLSVSCSDKLAKWCHLGIQGALLMQLLNHPIYLSTITMLKQPIFELVALNRALYDRLGRVELEPPFEQHKLDIYLANEEFEFRKLENAAPCSSSIIWFANNGHQVAVDGRKQGATKKQLLTEKGRLKVCKLEMFKLFNQLMQGKSSNFTYKEAKFQSVEYQRSWDVLKRKFGVWPEKDLKLLQFLPK